MQQAGTTVEVAGQQFRIIHVAPLVPDRGAGADLALYTLVDADGQRYTMYAAQIGGQWVQHVVLAPVVGYTLDQVAAGIEQQADALARRDEQ